MLYTQFFTHNYSITTEIAFTQIAHTCNLRNLKTDYNASKIQIEAVFNQ